jgi:hypothetical protein
MVLGKGSSIIMQYNVFKEYKITRQKKFLLALGSMEELTNHWRQKREINDDHTLYDDDNVDDDNNNNKHKYYHHHRAAKRSV